MKLALCLLLALSAVSAAAVMATPAVAAPAGPDIYESDDTTATAKAILTDATPQDRTMHNEDDRDFAKFQCVAGRRYAVRVAEPVGGLSNLLFYVWSPTLESVTEDTIYEWADGNGGDGFQFDAEETGTHYVVVSTWYLPTYSSGQYILQVEEVPKLEIRDSLGDSCSELDFGSIIVGTTA